MKRSIRHGDDDRQPYRLQVEKLELRTLLSASAIGNEMLFAPGELVVGFEGEVPAVLEAQGQQQALDLAQHLVGGAGLHSGRILYSLPASSDQPARVATHWQLPVTISVQQATRQLTQISGVAYAEPNLQLTSQSIPGDASFVGDWEFGVQEHLPQIGAPDAWQITTGDPGVVVAVVDTGVDLDHPDLNDNLLPGRSFVAGATSPQDDHGHGTQIAGLIAAEMDNLTELASEAKGEATWAGGVVGVGDLDDDGDHDVDVLVGNAWYENTNGVGTFNPTRIPIEPGLLPDQVRSIADMDGDGDLDVVKHDAWNENLDGRGTFGPAQPIIRLDTNNQSAVDLDSDGDIDLLANLVIRGAGGSRKTVWYENTDGQGDFGEQRLIASKKQAEPTGSLDAADLDADGDQDVIAVGPDSSIVWYQNLRNGSSWIARPVTNLDGVIGFVLADLDYDTDLDLLANGEDPQTGRRRLLWYENLNGLGQFGPAEEILRHLESLDNDTPFLAVDLDRDGDNDIVAKLNDNSVRWYENLFPHAGDANRDGVFNSADFVQVFLAGEYEDDIEDNSTWEEGDWNGDMDFTSADFVVAFIRGLYEQKSGNRANGAVSAAIDWLFAEEDRLKRSRARG